MHKNWRDCKAWSDEGLPMSSTNNEACKLYDAAVTQYVSWYEDDSMGGLDGCITKMLQADPNFIMGHVVKNGLDLMGTGHSARLDAAFKQDISALTELASKDSASSREKKHAEAVKLWSEDQLFKACDVWEDILLDYPTDMLAIKYAHDAYFYLGHSAQIRDGPARCMPHWKPTAPLYGYLYGMHSFGLEETNLFGQAEKAGLKSLELNCHDTWATHAVAHVMEMMGRQNDGIKFLSTTVKDWEPYGMLACHNFWHWAVYHIEKNEHQAAVDIFDAEINPRCTKSGAMLDIVDSCSMLQRLQLEGIDIGDRWNAVYETCRPHIDDHILSFNDVHVLMSCLGSNNKETAEKMMASLEAFVRDHTGDNRDVAADVGRPLMKSFVAYNDGDFASAVDILYPLRYKVIRIGGSNAQRDLFNLFLINCALKSAKKEHHKLARYLLLERKAFKENGPMTDRLINRAMVLLGGD